MFELDLSDFLKELRKLGEVDEAVNKGARKGMNQAVTLWRNRVMRNVPYRAGNLEDGIDSKVTGTQVSTIVGTVSAEAWAVKPWKGAPFNYAYYIHEIKGRGGIPDKFIDDSFNETRAKIKEKIEHAILDELEKAGW
ncbi:MAG: HK97 gp10 family phage protein [Bacillota bacterium]